MRDRVKEIIDELAKEMYVSVEMKSGAVHEAYEFSEDELRLFIEQIAKRCLKVVKNNIYGPSGLYDYSYTEENYAADTRAETIYDEIKYSFGITE